MTHLNPADKAKARTNVDTILPGLLKTAINSYTYGARGTGRTAAMLKNAIVDLAKDDKVNAVFIFDTSGNKEYSRNLWGMLNAPHEWPANRTKFGVVEPTLYSLYEALQTWIPQPSKVYFDHCWLEQFHLNMLQQAHDELVSAVLALQQRGGE